MLIHLWGNESIMKSNYMTTIFLLLFSFFSNYAAACGEEFDCSNCNHGTEFSWNPSSENLTTSLKWFYQLEYEIEKAYKNNNYAEVERLVKQNLDYAKKYRCNWNYGNAIYSSNLILGLISFNKGEIDKSTEYLIRAGKTPGSPQLDSFGPNFDLANKLLRKGRHEEVKLFLKDINRFWKTSDGLVEEWITEINNGKTPNLKAYRNTNIASSVIINFIINVLFGTFFLWLSMLFVNKFMVSKHLKITCPFWKMLVAVAASTLLAYIPLVGWILSILAFFILVMAFTGAMVFEVLVMIIISKIFTYAVVIAVTTYFAKFS